MLVDRHYFPFTIIEDNATWSHSSIHFGSRCSDLYKALKRRYTDCFAKKHTGDGLVLHDVHDLLLADPLKSGALFRTLNDCQERTAA